MTRKHFNAIADALYQNQPTAGKQTKTYQAWLKIVKDMASTLSAFNGGFDRQRFIDACENGR